MTSEADTEPAPPPDLETRVSALEARADATDAHMSRIDQLERHLENLITVLRDEVREAFRRARYGVTNGGE